MMSIPHPADPTQRVKFFATWEKARRHLVDHLLTAPECNAWNVINAELATLVDLTDVEARSRAGDQIVDQHDRLARKLYDYYLRTTGEEVVDARRLGWFVQVDQTVVCIGTSGVLAVADPVVRTAFVPGEGDARSVRTSQVEAADRGRSTIFGLPRDAGMRSGRNPSDREARRRRELNDLRLRDVEQSPERRLYDGVFSPAVHFLIHRRQRGYDMLGRRRGVHFSEIVQVLPTLERLTFEHWMEFRRHCGRSVPT